jgi:C1A family cysteine protease
MKAFVFALCSLFTTSALAVPFVEIAGKRHATGLIPSEPAADARFWTPGRRGDVPLNYDAREFGLVTPIKNQGSCGSCWSFARTKALEAAYIKAGYTAADLAEQDALVNDDNSYGCNGGFMDGRFETNYGVTSEDQCPYRTSDRYSCNGTKVAKAVRWAFVGERNRKPTDEELKAAIYQYGVLAVEVAAGGGFRPNSAGDITTCNSSSINHMVTLTAYRTLASGAVQFLIGNSWGTSWGLEGFAWSKNGCNRLANSAMFFYIDPITPPNPPTPIDCDGLYSELGECKTSKAPGCEGKVEEFKQCVKEAK